MRDRRGALAEAARQFDSFLAFCPEPPKCVGRTERFRVPGVPGALGAEVARKLDGEDTPELAINFTKGAFACKVTVGGPRKALIEAATRQYERVP